LLVGWLLDYLLICQDLFYLASSSIAGTGRGVHGEEANITSRDRNLKNSYVESMSTGASNHEKIQTVVFVRHGVAKHNLHVDGKPPNLEDPMLFDPPLVFEGKKQALDVGERLRIWWHTTQTGEQIELVVTSPLTRCIQTASLAFLRGDCYTDGRHEPSFFCFELIREAYGMHYPDRRRNKSFLEVSIVDSSGRLPFSSSSCII
jgi:hypothetical protein